MDHMLQSEIGVKELREIQKELFLQGNARLPTPGVEEHAGCTANVCFVTPDEIYVANAGDSRTLGSVGGRMVCFSYDHKPNDKSELKRIKKAGGIVSGGRVNMNLNLSRSIGDLEFKMNPNLKPS